MISTKYSISISKRVCKSECSQSVVQSSACVMPGQHVCTGSFERHIRHANLTPLPPPTNVTSKSVFMWRHIKPNLQVIILATAMLISSLYGTILEDTTKFPVPFYFSSYHNTKLQLSDNNISTHTLCLHPHSGGRHYVSYLALRHLLACMRFDRPPIDPPIIAVWSTEWA